MDSPNHDILKETFMDLMGRYSLNKAYNQTCWAEIEDSYSSGIRFYHNLNHLARMLSELQPVKSYISDRDTLLFAIFYHDIIYEPTQNDNEHKSARLFNRRISQTSFARLDRCKAHMEATARHEESADPDTNILLDLDISIFGQNREEYEKYRENIRKEFSIYPDAIYRKGRTKVLRHFLEMEFIYKNEYFRKIYEVQARTNLATELRYLRKP